MLLEDRPLSELARGSGGRCTWSRCCDELLDGGGDDGCVDDGFVGFILASWYLVEGLRVVLQA